MYDVTVSNEIYDVTVSIYKIIFVREYQRELIEYHKSVSNVARSELKYL